MKTRILLLFAALALCGCSWLKSGDDEESASICVGFESESYLATKAAYEIPDTTDFLLTVSNSSGKVLYDGAYGASPEQLLVGAGTYTIKVISDKFDKPAFDKPQYGDEQCVVVKSGESVKVKLLCSQLNAGVKLKVSPNFLTAYPKGLLYLKSSQGKLQWAYRESRPAYFSPGAVSLVLSNEAKEQTLLTRSLLGGDMFCLNVSATIPKGDSSSEQGSSLSIDVDTTRNWYSGSFTIGGGSSSGGAESSQAIGVGEVKDHAGESDVWVCGYIVGGDLSSSATGIKFQAPFSSNTNIAIAARSSVSIKSSCVSVQLAAGDVREDLNLVDNPENIGKKVYIKGDIVAAYYGLPGIKNVTEYSLK